MSQSGGTSDSMQTACSEGCSMSFCGLVSIKCHRRNDNMINSGPKELSIYTLSVLSLAEPAITAAWAIYPFLNPVEIYKAAFFRFRVSIFFAPSLY